MQVSLAKFVPAVREIFQGIFSRTTPATWILNEVYVVTDF